jgi:hypothetical protein
MKDRQYSRVFRNPCLPQLEEGDLVERFQAQVNELLAGNAVGHVLSLEKPLFESSTSVTQKFGYIGYT